MPGEDGPSLLTHAYTSYPKTTRILMTAQADQALLQRSVNHAKVDQVLYKPVQANEWLIVLEELSENSDVLEEVTPQMGSLELKEGNLKISMSTSLDSMRQGAQRVPPRSSW